MQKLFITKENLQVLVRNLKKTCDEFIAPKREHLDDIIFGDTRETGGELLEYDGNSVISPRAFLLPQTEPLFEIRSKGVHIPIEDKKKRIFYGIRPCDIKALALMRHFFLDGIVDTPYKQRLERSTFIALACNRLCSDEAFCCEMDAGPMAKEGFDLQLTAVKRGCLVDCGTKKGSQIVKDNKKLFEKASPSDAQEARQLAKEFARGCRTKGFDYKKVAKIMAEDKVKKEIWDDIGLRCVVCSGCITLCPTCSCFSIVDRLSNGKGERIRYCDGCPYAGFTRMAGGNTPFPMHKDHIRRFFEHKLNVDVERYGRPSCVGCGRCIETCLGNISVKKFLTQINTDDGTAVIARPLTRSVNGRSNP